MEKWDLFQERVLRKNELLEDINLSEYNRILRCPTLKIDYTIFLMGGEV